MPFNIHELKSDYLNQKSPYREAGKYLFSFCTLGLGALYLSSSTVVIREGQIGVREDAKGNITLLPPGRHSNFPWESYPSPVQSLSKPVIKLGPYTLVTIETGYIGKTLNKGKLEILEAGQHLLKQADHIFHAFLPIKQETKELKEITAITHDNVGLQIHADVRYKISDPKLAISTVDDIEKSIKEIAEMQLSQVIGHHTRQELIPAASGISTHLAKDSNDDSENEQDNKLLQNKQGANTQGVSLVIKELINGLGAKLKLQGISLIDIGIKSWKIIDKTLAHEFGHAAVTRFNTETKLIIAKRDAEILQIHANAEALAITTKAQAMTQAAELYSANPIARELATLEKDVEIVGAAKPGTVLHYGANGIQGFFQAQRQPHPTQDVHPADLTPDVDVNAAQLH